MVILLEFPDLGEENRTLEKWFEDRVYDKSPENESFLKYARNVILLQGRNEGVRR